jgi:hypothetical protein
MHLFALNGAKQVLLVVIGWQAGLEFLQGQGK